MTLATITEQLTTLGFSGFKSSLEKQMERTEYHKLTFEERLYQLLEAEINERTNRKIKRLLTQAKFKDRQASIDEIEFSLKRGLDRSVILSLSSGQFIQKHQNILVTGPAGVGNVKCFDM